MPPREATIDEAADLVGCKVSVTLNSTGSAQPVTIEAIVFTYVPAKNLLVLLQNITSQRSTVKVISTQYIQSFRVLEASDELPHGLSRGAQLPTLQDKEEKLPKALSKRLKDAEQKRQYPVGDANFTVEAADVFDYLSRLYTVVWRSDSSDMLVEQKVVVSSTAGSWRPPKVAPLQAGSEADFTERVSKTVQQHLATINAS